MSREDHACEVGGHEMAARECFLVTRNDVPVCVNSTGETGSRGASRLVPNNGGSQGMLQQGTSGYLSPGYTSK